MLSAPLLRLLAPLVALLAAAAGAQEPFSVAALVAALQRHLFTRCVFFMQPWNTRLSEKRSMLDAQRTLAWSGVAAATISYHQFRQQRPTMRCDSRPLYVVLRADLLAHDFLKQVAAEPGWDLNGATEHWNDTAAMLERPLWLLLMDAHSDGALRDFFEDVDIPFNCQVLSAKRVGPRGWEMREVYRVAPSLPLLHNWLGSLHAGRLRLNPLPFYDRRPSLHNLTVRAVAKHHPPFAVLNLNSSIPKVKGYIGRVWEILERRMNFSTLIARTLEESVSNDEMIEMLEEGAVDIGLVGTSVRGDRLHRVQFSLPVMTTQFRVFIEKPTFAYLRWGSFLAPFAPGLWVAVLCALLLLAAALTAAAAAVRRWGDAAAEHSGVYTPPHSLFVVFGAFCLQGHELTPRSCACRLVYWVAYMTAVTQMAAYSAALISTLTANEWDMPFQDVRGLLADGHYTFGCVRGSTPELLLNVSTDPEMQLLRDVAPAGPLRDAWPSTLPAAAERLCNEKFALMYNSDATARLNQMLPCDLAPLPGFSMAAVEAFPARRGWPYRGLLDHNLVRMQRCGTMKKLLDDARPSSFRSAEDASQGEFPPVDLGDTAPILAALALGACGALLALAGERALGAGERLLPRFSLRAAGPAALRRWGLLRTAPEESTWHMAAGP